MLGFEEFRITVTSRAAGMPLLQHGRKGRFWMFGMRGDLFSGCKGSRLSCRKQYIPNGIVSEDPITISTTSYLMVSKNVSWVVTFRALLKHLKAQPVTMSEPELLVKEIQAERSAWYDIEPISCVSDGTWEPGPWNGRLEHCQWALRNKLHWARGSKPA